MTPVEVRILTAAVAVITSALVFYTVGVWGERLQKGLRGWHVLCFILGIMADFTGTSLMAELVRLTGKDDRLHEITGLIAVCIMTVHVIWAVWTYWKGPARARRHFSRFSVAVWFIWLIPYGIGVYLGMALHV